MEEPAQTKTEGIYNVVFSYVEEKAGVFAAESAVRIAEALIKEKNMIWIRYSADARIREIGTPRAQVQVLLSMKRLQGYSLDQVKQKFAGTIGIW